MYATESKLQPLHLEVRGLSKELEATSRRTGSTRGQSLPRGVHGPHGVVNLDRDLQMEYVRLSARLDHVVRRLERLSRIEQFVSPQVTSMVDTLERTDRLHTHTGEIAVLFCDLRGFTAFVESTDDCEASRFLKEYHECLDEMFHRYDATLDSRAGDGAMAFIGDPTPLNPPIRAIIRAVRLACELRTEVSALCKQWKRPDCTLGVGMSLGYGPCSIGVLGGGFRSEYTANGRVVNLASRMCDLALDGQILITRSVRIAIEERARFELLPAQSVKGVKEPVEMYNLLGLRRSEVSSRSSLSTEMVT